MKILTTEEKELLKKYSEGNEYLYDALCTCWENGIGTYACCAGHLEDTPYLGIILNKQNLPYIKNIVGILQDVKDISISSGIRGRGSESGIPPNEECRSLLIYGSGSNRCEMFYKIKQAILCSLTFKQMEIKDSRAKQFIKNLEALVDMSYDEILKDISDGVGIGTTFSNNSEELIEYYFNFNSKKNYINKIMNILGKIFPFINKINENRIYSKMQHSYSPTLKVPDDVDEEIDKSNLQVITFDYALAHPEAQVMLREKEYGRGGSRYTGLLKPIKIPEPFVGFKAKTIADVEQIYTGPQNPGITSKNITAYIEEPCIPVFQKLQKLGIETCWASANSGDVGTYHSASISIVPKTLSKENKEIAEKLGLEDCFGGYGLEVKIERTDTVQDVSDKFLKLCEDFVEQPVLYGQQSQTEYLNSYCKYNKGDNISRISNIDENYINNHLNYLLTNFPEYISFDGEKYTCMDMPDELFQKEVINRDISIKIYHHEDPLVCKNGVVWASQEIYDINETNIRIIKEKKKELSKENKNKSNSQSITFEYALANPDVQVMTCEIIPERYGQDKGLLKPVKTPEPFVGFKAKTIKDVKRIHQGPKNPAITSKNITEYIEEPCIAAFLKLQKLGIQTNWSSANESNTGEYRSAYISIVTETLSKENLDVIKKLDLKYKKNIYGIEVEIKLTDTVQEVSDKFLKLCDVFTEQPVLYGHKSQTEYLNSYCKKNSARIAEISNIDENYINDHLSYLLKNFSKYISFDGEHYTCMNMPDDLFQREILDRELSRKIFYEEPSICIEGVVWESKELYDINKNNTKNNLKKDEESFERE